VTAAANSLDTNPVVNRSYFDHMVVAKILSFNHFDSKNSINFHEVAIHNNLATNSDHSFSHSLNFSCYIAGLVY